LQITKETLCLVLDQLKKRLEEKKSNGKSFSSEHEVLGKIHEELYEFTQAIHERQDRELKKEELLDIALNCIWGACGYEQGMKEKKKRPKL
jgi:NTP pyrophosphatase (non-canonical NTP hydrolase)